MSEGRVWIFIDKKEFIVDEAGNPGNMPVIDCNPTEVPPLMNSKNPATVKIFAGVTSEGTVIPSHFVEIALIINAEEYLKILNDVFLTWT